MRLKRALLVGAAVVATLAAGIFGGRALVERFTSRSPTDARSESGVANPLAGGFEGLAIRVSRAVVNINTERLGGGHPSPLDFFDRVPRISRSSLGSGFIVNSDGYILTSSQVVEQAARISVKLGDKRTFEATVIGADPETDLAVLKIRSSGLPSLPLVSSDEQVAVGDWVAAFGSPFDLDQTMTAGIISAKGSGDRSRNFLQTDAALNPGNSGGPLVNLSGEVVGVAIGLSPSRRGFSGIGFAIPAGTVRRTYDRLTRSGKGTRGWLGIQIQDVTPEIARALGLREGRGALVAEVSPSSPAAQAGLRPGDIVTEFNGERIGSARDLTLAVAQTGAGTVVRLKIMRDGSDARLTVRVGERPSTLAEAFRSPGLGERGRLGVTVTNVTPALRAELELKSTTGALVVEVAPGSPASSGGVLPGDVILEINRTRVHNAEKLSEVFGALEQGKTVLLGIQRAGEFFYIAFDLS